MEKDSNTIAQGISDDQMHWNLECEMLSGNVMMICQVTIFTQSLLFQNNMDKSSAVFRAHMCE